MINASLIILEGNMSGLGTAILLILLLALSPAIVATIIGFVIKNKRPKAAKYLFILSGIYLIIGLGICGTLLS